MSTHEPPGLFLTGSDTGVGKSYVGALIARQLAGRGLRVGVYKPAASGCLRDPTGDLVSEDAVALWEAAGRPLTLAQVCPQRFAAPLAPHLAARAEGRRVDRGLLVAGLAPWREACDVILVEGAGGLLSPLSDEWLNADLAAALGYPLLIVVANKLGAINQTLLTVQGARTFVPCGEAPPAASTRSSDRCSSLTVAGVILSEPSPPDPGDPSRSSNAAEIARWSSVPLLAAISHGVREPTPAVDWLKVAQDV